MSLFKYQPLALDEHHIRLLDILPELSPDDNLVQCTMEHSISLSHQPETSDYGVPEEDEYMYMDSRAHLKVQAVYSGLGYPEQEKFDNPRKSLLSGRQPNVRYLAVSYSWGALNPETDRVVLINGERYSIRENLCCFLDASRGKIGDKLWIDQLCIDQNNVMERNHQVSQMALIYASAASVIIWLGNEADHSSEAIKYMADARRKGVCDITAINRHFASLFAGRPFVESEALAGLQLASEALANRLYWSRLWIVQEILWARKIQIFCGELSLPWVDFLDLVQYCKLSHVQRLANARAVFQTRFVQPSAIIEYCRLDCSEPADKIFALQSLLPSKYQVEIDYAKPLRDIFLEMLAILSRGPEWFGISGNYYWPPDNSLLFLALGVKSELDLEDVSEHDMADAMIADRLKIPEYALNCHCLADSIRRRVVDDLTNCEKMRVGRLSATSNDLHPGKRRWGDLLFTMRCEHVRKDGAHMFGQDKHAELRDLIKKTLGEEKK